MFSLSVRSANERDLTAFDFYGPTQLAVAEATDNAAPLPHDRTLVNASPSLVRRKSASNFKSTCFLFLVQPSFSRACELPSSSLKR